MPTRSVNSFKYCQYIFFFSAPYFAPLPFMYRCYFTPFFHTVADPRDRSRAPLPERPLQTPGNAGPSGGPSNFQAPTSFTQGQLKAPFCLRKLLLIYFCLHLCLTPPTSFRKLLLTPPRSLFYRWKLRGFLLLPEQGQAQALPGTSRAGIQGPSHRELSPFSQGEPLLYC